MIWYLSGFDIKPSNMEEHDIDQDDGYTIPILWLMNLEQNL